ncbi:MAG: hypothetical protein K5697_08195 [Lachnospiraceae bacterium]|nr:hypothetical protein [Lachnospiraceae bacterium]
MVRKTGLGLLLLLTALLGGCGKDTGDKAGQPVVLDIQEGTYAFVRGDGEKVGPWPSPTPTPVVVVTPTPVPEAEPAAPAQGTTSIAVDELRAIQYSAEEEQKIQDFYENTVFTGDSVLLGFRNYCARSEDPLCKKLEFLASGSYSLHNAFVEVGEKSIHPLYQGQQYPLWESIPMMGAKRVFLFFGINDVSWGVQDAINLYPLLIERIQEAAPGIDVTIISATYTLAGAGKGGINNANLAEFNEGVAKVAAERGWGFIDMANTLSDGNGNLAPQYCSDSFLHETSEAYDVWYLMMKAYAAERLGIR